VNVLGLDGMKAMMEDGAATPLRVYVTTPSCVPAAQGLENSGSILTAEDIAKTMTWDGIAGLGEMMDYNGILSGNEEAHKKVAVTLAAHKTVTGHFPLSDTGAALNAYIASGITCCHESIRAEEALAKMRMGAYAMIREGSAWNDLPEVIRAITENKIDTRFAVLVSDDLHADSLINTGHMDYIIRLAIRHGVNPVTAIQMATINAASCFGLTMDIGSITPGRYADINILDSLVDVKVAVSIIGGKFVSKNGALKSKIGGYIYPNRFMHTVNISENLKSSDFEVAAPDSYNGVKVIEVHEASVITTQNIVKLPVQNGKITATPESNICKAAVINRHHNAGQKGIGFVKGLGIAKGAVASTYAHDAHNLLVVGASDDDMAFAANVLINCGGGMVAVENGKVLSLLELPIAGLLSTKPADEVADALKELENAWRILGSGLVSPFMTMSLLSLAVIPEIRITDKGIVDVLSGKLVPLFV
jgi:adenine deaminase